MEAPEVNTDGFVYAFGSHRALCEHDALTKQLASSLVADGKEFV